MNIELQKTGDLTATLKIDLSPSDYEEKVNKVLKEYQRKAQMPGFRPGKVPFGLTKKMYGQAATADEINKLLGDALENYIKENNLELLGNPIANTEKTPEVDWTTATELSFYFDLGLAPAFEVNLTPEIEIPYLKIEASDKMAADYLADIQKRQGIMSDVESVEAGDVVNGDFVELNQDGSVKEDGIKSSGTINTATLTNTEILDAIIGLQAGAAMVVNAKHLAENTNDIATILGVSPELTADIEADFKFTITSISRMLPAELNEEFFDKVFPGEEIKTQEAVLEKIKIEATQSFVNESDKKFLNDSIEKLLELADISLPDEFVKRWLVDTNPDKLNAEEVERDYNDYARSLRWQLIENKIVQQHELFVTQEEVKDVFRGYFRRPGAASIEMDDETKQRIDTIAETFMKNKEDAGRIRNQLFEQKLISLLKEKLEPKQQNLSYEEFVKLASHK